MSVFFCLQNVIKASEEEKDTAAKVMSAFFDYLKLPCFVFENKEGEPLKAVRGKVKRNLMTYDQLRL